MKRNYIPFVPTDLNEVKLERNNKKKERNQIVREPISLLHPFSEVIFAFEGSYITSAMRKSMLGVPVLVAFDI